MKQWQKTIESKVQLSLRKIKNKLIKEEQLKSVLQVLALEKCAGLPKFINFPKLALPKFSMTISYIQY